MQGRVLIVAGSDSGGGAGIQADIKAVTALDGYAMTAITALTAQDTHGVHGIHTVPVPFLVQQMELVLADLGADAVKTGMLATAEVIHAVADTLTARAPGVKLVADPVMVAKGGHRLLDMDATDAVLTRLLPLASVLTPNVPEAEALTGLDIRTIEDMRRAGRDLLARGARAVLMKGGHMEGPVLTDLLLTADGEHAFLGERLDTRHTHGTGCTLASAIATGLAQGLDVVAAVARARRYVDIAIRTAPGYGQGHGPLNHSHTVGAFA
ncbi:bifunctional hydroxymethylpyrimidine kinase/phosphomethylpyrimidine kinase [Niveispirillum sp. BGYR6]|uniref:bifunctional hydroxymethylpyrimidine kinase/phosphomethylpyrimidine kinase n=1 Tax=Niveispirillum sp. BGYR6 TaxID=2971249 RepID=UPI0022B9C4D5|nr:bifunctional hydroxymethylpyrimidine kinase/phosphomethylpyrimidine kinase [Niveispirillum sp. BGYR6]MDG5494227.1 bifunctional hydroxymethylpyrimidine kinase/phosphomethylpyrimidine kinase [Niveispirillum sp. BGYR6]